MTDKKNMQVVGPEDKGYKDLATAVKKRTSYRVDYEELATTYNASEVGSILLLEADSAVRTHNLNSVLENRGLVRNEDFSSCKMTTSQGASHSAHPRRSRIF